MSELKRITLTTQKQMEIYMNPQRQRLLKTMYIYGEPMTAKQLSDILKISASSVSLHIKKLMTLGLIELDHMESIHGIQAKYYRKVPAFVSLEGARDDDLKEERNVLMDYIMSDIWDGFKKNFHEVGSDIRPETVGDLSTGIVHLSEKDAMELYHKIIDFINSHTEPGENTIPWQVAFLAYPQKLNSGKEDQS